MNGKKEEIIKWLEDQEPDEIYTIRKKAKRTLDSNSYLWVLCKSIADKLRITKEEVYQKAIHESGTFTILPIKDEAVETFIDRWQAKGVGWLCEVLHKSKLPGYTNVVAYYGSSTYDSKEMSLLIDNVIYEAKQLDIETLPPDQIAQMNQEWDERK